MTISPDTNGAAGGPAQTIDPAINDIWKRYEQFKTNDNLRNSFIEEMIFRYEFQNKTYAQNYEALQNAGKLVQQRDALQEQLRQITETLNRDSFVTILIDGDGMIFNEKVLQAAENGGHSAAKFLYDSVRAQIAETMPNLPPDVKIVVRVYANLKGLAEAAFRSGLVENPAFVEDFLRGFTANNPLFDFVDVGPRRDRTLIKISEAFTLFVHDFHCKHVYLGCSHNDSYTRLLERYSNDPATRSRVTLLLGPPLEHELSKLNFPAVQFSSLFRHSKISTYAVDGQGSPLPAAIGTHIVANTPPVNGYYTPPSRSVANTPLNIAAIPFQPMRRTTSNSTTGTSDAPSAGPVPNTWASLAKKAHADAEKNAEKAAAEAAKHAAYLKANPPSPPATPQELLNQGIVPRNRHGQRVDPPTRAYDKDEVVRMRKMKLCNVHHLRGPCPFHSKCTHDHNYEPTKDELSILKLVTRLTPCHNGSGCDDVYCIYGHRCLAPLRGEGKTGKNCILGDECKFDAGLHTVDTAVVRASKV